MHADSPKLLWDALAAVDRLRRFLTGRDFADYMADELLRSAVERQLEIAGEALSQLRRIDSATAEEIPDLSRLIALRNVLIHGYASVDNHIVWGVIETHLAPIEDWLRKRLPS